EPTGGETVEVLVAGDEGAVRPSCLALSNQAASALASLDVRARAYLREFLAPKLLESLAGWALEGVEAGCGEARRADQVALVFSDPADAYGHWSVTFQLSSGHLIAVALARRQI